MTKIMTNRPPAAVTPIVNGRCHRQDTSPLQWWREEHARQVDPADVAKLRKMLSSIALPGQRDWTAAVQGDAPAAVRMALRIGATSAGLPDWRLDCAGSVVLLCAIAGNAAAATALAHLRRRFGSSRLTRTKGA
jgi:hypothetical protein